MYGPDTASVTVIEAHFKRAETMKGQVEVTDLAVQYQNLQGNCTSSYGSFPLLLRYTSLVPTVDSKT